MTVQFVINAGSVDDPQGLEGLTAISLQLLREGGTDTLSAYDVEEQLFATAATINVRVDREVSVIEMRVHKDHLQAMMSLLTRMMTRPLLNEEAFERLKRDALHRIINDLRGSEEEWLAEEALYALIYKDHPYGHPVVGTVTGLESISKQRIAEHLQNILCVPRITLAITGNVSRQLENHWTQEITNSLRSTCSLRRTDVIRNRSTISVRPNVHIIEHQGAQASTVRMMLPYDVTRSHSDYEEVFLFSSYVGLHGQFIGRLMQSIREMRGLNYGDYTYAEYFEPSSHGRGPESNITRSLQSFEVVLRPFQPEQILFVIKLVFREIENVLLHGIDDHEFARVQNFLQAYLPLWFETDEARLGSMIDQMFYGLNGSWLSQLQSQVHDLDSQSVIEAARRHIDLSQMHVVIVTQDGELLRQAFLANAPSLIEYDHTVNEEIMAEDREISVYPLHRTDADIEIVRVDSLFE